MPAMPPAAPDLRADCATCVGICCIVPGFAASAGFAFSKAPGAPCRHLDDKRRCGIHGELVSRGMRGCGTYDCFGAGQSVTATLGLTPGRRLDLEVVEPVFRAAEALHELLWLLDDAAGRALSPRLAATVGGLQKRLLSLTNGEQSVLAVRDPRESGGTVAELRGEVGEALREVSREVQSGRPSGRDVTRLSKRLPDLAGARLAHADLRAADLRGALLLGADLSGSDLRGADLLGADLRGVDLRGADLGDALFLTVPQLRSARVDRRTRVPERLAE